MPVEPDICSDQPTGRERPKCPGECLHRKEYADSPRPVPVQNQGARERRREISHRRAVEAKAHTQISGLIGLAEAFEGAKVPDALGDHADGCIWACRSQSAGDDAQEERVRAVRENADANSGIDEKHINDMTMLINGKFGNEEVQAQVDTAAQSVWVNQDWHVERLGRPISDIKRFRADSPALM